MQRNDSPFELLQSLRILDWINVRSIYLMFECIGTFIGTYWKHLTFFYFEQMYKASFDNELVASLCVATTVTREY